MLQRRGSKALGQRHRIHGPGTGATDAGKGETAVFEQGIEHAPGKSPMRATALKCQIQALRRGCRGIWVMGYGWQ